jgi:hypothetical protein
VFSRVVRGQGLPPVLPAAAVFAAGLALLARLVPPDPLPVAAQAGLRPPTGLAASLEDGRMRLHWTPSVGAAGYAVYCGTHSGDERASIAYVGGGSDTAVVPVIRPGQVQYCRLRATRGRLGSLFSDEVHAPRLEAPWQEMRFD